MFRDRRPAALLCALLLATALVAAACGDDSDEGSSKKTTTTEKAAQEDAPGTTATAPEFDEAIGAVSTGLEDAGDDQCKVMAALATSDSLPEPADAAQMKLYVSFVRDAYKAIADSAPEDQAQNAAVVRTAADALYAEVEEKGFDPAILTSGESPTAITDEVNTALQGLSSQAATACTDSAPGAEAPSTTAAG